MPKTLDELPRRSWCKYKEHSGPRWLSWVFFNTYWVTNPRNGVSYIYLYPHCQTCTTIKRRSGKGRTGNALTKFSSQQERLERKRELEMAGYRRRTKNKAYRLHLREAEKMRRLAKRQMQSRPEMQDEH